MIPGSKGRGTRVRSTKSPVGIIEKMYKEETILWQLTDQEAE